MVCLCLVDIEPELCVCAMQVVQNAEHPVALGELQVVVVMRLQQQQS